MNAPSRPVAMTLPEFVVLALEQWGKAASAARDGVGPVPTVSGIVEELLTDLLANGELKTIADVEGMSEVAEAWLKSIARTGRKEIN